ncbi:MAG: hypothetical protein QGG67_16160 [Gammaproteobacteria bacterium]|jgi:hypothetical protein|nr:hypothetical protein [Gammaproteobacteria bacterium]|tara:strand:+ start:980 stop:1804 length:825 start_codon:yes stop_codon:yes gene_type:complete
MSRNRLNQNPSTRRYSRKKKSPLFRVASFGIVALVIYYFTSSLFSRVERDNLTLCRLDRAFSRDTALLIDETGGYSQAQADLISTSIENILTNSLVDDKFTFYSLGESVSSYLPSFSICNPGDESDQGDLTTDQRRLFADWKEDSHDRVVSSLDELVDREAAEFSPIMEMIRYVSNQTRFSSPDIQKRMIIVSDLIQNTPSYSQHNDSKDFDTIRGTNYLTGVQAFLSGVDVQILYVQRPQLLAIQNRDHIESFWRPYVNLSEGRIVSVDRINL